jgi:uncharacterized protein (TIGR00255 family)
MTGFGQAEVTLGGRRFRVELRTVNHRYLDTRIRLPPELMEHAPLADAILKRRIGRGRVEMTARLGATESGSGLTLDVERARDALSALVSLRDELAPSEPVPLTLLGAVPDLFAPPSVPGREDAKRVISESVAAACEDLDAMRVNEGAALMTDFEARLDNVRGHVDAIEEVSDELVEAQRRRLQERLDQLLKDSGTSLDPGRLEQEVAILADKSDVTEELTRLRSHLDQFRTSMKDDATGEGEAMTQVGRKLDFLVQEMNREVNTIGSKCSDAGVAHTVVAMKAELERIREQVQNVV